LIAISLDQCPAHIQRWDGWGKREKKVGAQEKQNKREQEVQSKETGDKSNAQDTRQGRKQEMEKEKSQFLKKRCCCA